MLKDTAINLPIAEIIRERLTLAADQLADSAAKLAVAEQKKINLERENGKLQAQIEAIQAAYTEEQKDHQRLKEEHAEEVIVHQAIEWRKGKRTRDKWLPFCPGCHLPAIPVQHAVIRCSRVCGWHCSGDREDLARYSAELV